MSRRTRTIKTANREAAKFRPAAYAAMVAVGLALGSWLIPAHAQHGDTPPPPPPADAPTHAPAAEPHGSAEHTAPHSGSGGAAHQGADEHGSQGDAHGGGGHAAAGHGEGGHGEGGHGEEEHSEGVSIHQPTWLSTPIKRFWWSGPATLSAQGALTASGEPIPGESLKGQQVEYTFVDHHSHASPKPRVEIKPTIGAIGNQHNPAGAKLETVTVTGQEVVLINPTVSFAYESMFPELWVISMLVAITIALVTFLLTRNLQRVPNRVQTFLEMVYSFFDNFVHELIGDHYKRYVPLVGTIFIYVLLLNLSGLIPGWASPTANINIPAGLALVVVLYVQYEGIRVNGLKGYLMHFVGDPWWLGPLNVPIHVIGEVARLLSLTIRLFGNIFGEDVVIVILIFLAGMFTKGFIPFQAPMYLLAIFSSFVQAMVFSILTCVYIALMTTHEHEHEHGHGEHGHEEHGVYHDGHAPAPAV